MNKTKFGTKEIIATVVTVTLVCGERALEEYMVSQGISGMIVFDWVNLQVLTIMIAAVFFGPISGAVCAIGGDLLVNILFEESINYPEILVLGLYGFFMGMYIGQFHYDRLHFSFKDFIDFNAVQIMGSIILAMFLMPMLEFLINDANLYESVIEGTKQTIGTSVVVGLICPFIMMIVAMVAVPHRKGIRGT
ncbi:MAG: ECF transporter S component [Lachnospiraceae bacterium]|nr:ECF transporter S component [Lachnospiraceae bacterium]